MIRRKEQNPDPSMEEQPLNQQKNPNPIHKRKTWNKDEHYNLAKKKGADTR